MEISAIANLLFFDIETVSQYKTYADFLDKEPEMAKLWEKKARSFKKYEEYKDLEEDELLSVTYHDKAALFPEFGKIVVISTGLMVPGDDLTFKEHVKSYPDMDEVTLLTKFQESMSNALGKRPKLTLCGFNIKMFDIPYVAKRMMINGLTVPTLFNNTGKKPWEVQVLDLAEVWQQGSREMVSLELVCVVLGIPTPKDDIHNYEVGDTYWNATDIDAAVARLSVYCQKDVKACMKIVDKIKDLI